MSLPNSILENLNDAQHTAVTSPSNSLQILAPPGSGKTKTLTSRLAYLLLHNHYKPWNIICLTFTIKSSREMKERVAKLLGNGIERRLILGTFHSVCRRYLVTYGHLIGVRKDFGIADSNDTLSIIKRIVKRLGLTIDPRKAQSRISSSKSRGVSHDDLAPMQGKNKNMEQQEFSCVFRAYEDQLAKSNLLDYDDLLIRCVDLLRQHPLCVSNIEVVLIDEFQDTNIVQFDLVRLFAAKHQRVTTVGDPDQSIYGWRSAEIKNLKRMEKQYPDTLVICLENNYRSSGAILLAAKEVIEQDESRPSKPLLPTHCPGTVPVLRRLPASDVEASWIVSEIKRAIGLTGQLLTNSDFAILLRSAALSRHIESALGKAGIPYRMVGGHRFFDRIEVKILLDYLRVISQTNNNDALSRIINVPARGIGTSTSKGLLEEAEAKKVTVWALARDAVQGHSVTKTRLSKAAQQGLGSFINIILTSRAKTRDAIDPQSPEDVLKYILKKLEFQAYLEKTYPDDHVSRWANVEELITQASEYPISKGQDIGNQVEDLPILEGLEQAKGNVGEEALSRFLANVALATELQREDEDVEGNENSSQVVISTIHAAKGLEWPVVFVPSIYDGSLPHSRAEDTDEERRLLYVAMTRAQALLYLSCPTKNSQNEETTLSPFLTPKRVGKYLVNKGPTIDSSAVADIARILKRDCPTQPQIFAASSEVKSLHDDLWPLSGKEDVGAAQSTWRRSDGYDAQEHVAKRRRTKEKRYDDAHEAFGDGSNVLRPSGFRTTMDNRSAFSCNQAIGFISASSRLQELDQQKDLLAESKVLAKEAQVSLKIVPRGGQKVSSTQKGSPSDLMAFWSKAETSRRDNDLSEAGDYTGNDSLLGSASCHDSEGLFTAAKNEFAHLDGEGSRKRVPLAMIPQALSAHRLQPKIDAKQHSLTNYPDEIATKQYPFFSSSPPSTERESDEAQLASAYAPNKGADRDSEASKATFYRTDLKSANTLHKTSISLLQVAAKPPRKTLGVRGRSMNGWAERASASLPLPMKTGSR